MLTQFFQRDFAVLFAEVQRVILYLESLENAGPPEKFDAEVARACLEHAEIDYSEVRRLAPEELRVRLGTGTLGAGKAIVLSELLAAHGRHLEKQNQPADAVRCYLQAYCLLGDAVTTLPPDALELYRPRLRLLGGKLAPFAGDAYVGQKLAQFRAYESADS